jgi:Cu2+-exporting ATPase
VNINSLAGEGCLTNRSNAEQAGVVTGAPGAVAAGMECFHCSLPVPPDTQYFVATGEVLRAVCCAGCQAVASAILGQGLGDYYRLRDTAAETVLRQAKIEDLSFYDNPEIQQGFVRSVGGTSEALLLLEGIRCSACMWLNEQVISRIPGVLSANINYATHRAQIRWDPEEVRFSAIL